MARDPDISPPRWSATAGTNSSKFGGVVALQDLIHFAEFEIERFILVTLGSG